MTAPNSAHALHDILQRVVRSQAATFEQGWETVLERPAGTPAFVQRHAAVVELYCDVHRTLLAHPRVAVRDRYQRYLPQWYEAIVPRTAWDRTARPVEKLIDRTVLDHLAGLGDSLLARNEQHREPVPEAAIARLRDALGEWRALLPEADLPLSLQDEISAQVDRIERLLNNNRHDLNPVITEARRLVGRVNTVIGTRPPVKRRACAAILLTLAFLNDVDTGIDTASHILTGVNEISNQITELIDAPKHLLPTDDALAPPSAEVDGQSVVHDALIVEEQAPRP
ncbi:hypothetical protein [Nocardia wallacei]|uniref:hypothetical protein n=1 Tax=Nocardia wallacei TaxID=480035 RepID=UPI00245664A6|nr:hypothetical protein [Nocardia wallacei]